jgi:hypothetical protein
LTSIEKIKAAFMLLEHDVSGLTDEEILKLYNDSLIGGWARLFIEAADKTMGTVRLSLYGHNGEKIGEVIRATLKNIEKCNKEMVL